MDQLPETVALVAPVGEPITDEGPGLPRLYGGATFSGAASFSGAAFERAREFGPLLALAALDLDAADRRLFKLVPAVRKHGWMVVLRLAPSLSTSRETASPLD